MSRGYFVLSPDVPDLGPTDSNLSLRHVMA